MLMRQQALALIDARKTIVEGAVTIVRDAVERLHAAGLEMNVALSALTQRAPSHSVTVVTSKAVIRIMTMSAMVNMTPALRSGA